MRSALLSVKGVTRAQVRLEEHQALVTYDPALTKVEDLIRQWPRRKALRVRDSTPLR